MRTSNDKIVNDTDKFDRLYPGYLQVLNRLISLYPVCDGSRFGELVNFKTNKLSPKHGWYNYKQGYGEMLVKGIINQENPSKDTFVLDPFCGVGTTNLAAQSMGYNSIGFDINPMAILATTVKTHHFSSEEQDEINRRILNFTLPSKGITGQFGKAVETAFEEDVFDTILKIRKYIDDIAQDYVQRFFRLALISIIDDCSLKIKDGNGLKFRKNYKRLPSVVDHYLEKLRSMASDIENANYLPTCNTIFGSMMDTQTFESIEQMKVGLCIFSPPYANCFDYCEVYKLELWLGGFVNDYADFERYRSMAMRSHVNSKFDHQISNKNDDVDLIAELVSAFNVWNKNIPDMLRGYFDDMQKLLNNIKKVLLPGAKCFIVVANSGYKGILVPTDLLIADEAAKIGFKVNAIHKARKIRSSSQQMHVLHGDYDQLMRESVIEIEAV